MGVAFYPVFEDDSSWPDSINGKFLARAADVLDKACKKASVRILYDFYSMTREQMILELTDGDPDDPASFDETQLVDEAWHDAAEGLPTIRTMLGFVRSGHGRIENRDWVREDLEEFERLLTQAQSREVRWHLAIDA